MAATVHESATLNDDSKLLHIRTKKNVCCSGSWYGLGTGLKLADWQGGWLQGSVRAALYEIPAFQRGGSVLVAFETAADSLKTTQQKSNLTALVALNCPIKPRMLGGDPKVSCSYCTIPLLFLWLLIYSTVDSLMECQQWVTKRFCLSLLC